MRGPGCGVWCFEKNTAVTIFAELHMYRSTLLKSTHYAGQWVVPEKDQRNDLQVVNLLGYAYATSPDGPEKEAKLL